VLLQCVQQHDTKALQMPSKIELSLNLQTHFWFWINFIYKYNATDLFLAIGNEEIANIFLRQTNVDARKLFLFCHYHT